MGGAVYMNVVELLKKMQELSNLYFEGLITPQFYKGELQRLKNIADNIDKKLRDDDRKILELELRLADSEIDPLMGISSRKVLEGVSLVEKIPKSCTFIMCDIDDFSGINGKYGHLIGDEVLRIVGKKVREVITRSSDIVIRYGGDEILIMLPNCPPEKAAEKIETFRNLVINEVQKNSIVLEGGIGVKIDEPLTISSGIFYRDSEELGIQQSIENADTALYYTKQHRKGIDESGISIYAPDMPKIRARG